MARLCRNLKRPCIGLSGAVVARRIVGRFFVETVSLTGLTSAENAKKNAALWLEHLAEQVALTWSCQGYRRRK